MQITITCPSNDYHCYERHLVSFDDGQGPLDQESALVKALLWLDDMLSAVRGYHLLQDLERMRLELNGKKYPTPYPTVFAIPLAILQVVLKEYNLIIDVSDESTEVPL